MSHTNGWWTSAGFIHAQYAYGTWWGAVLFYNTAKICSPSDPQCGKPDWVAIAGGDHCQNCAAKADEIVAWVQRAIDEARTRIGPGPGQAREGMVTFAFTRDGAQVFEVLNALIAAFQNSDIPIIVSWTDVSGQVQYMCIGSAAACQALGNLAKQIACVQQGQLAYCDAREINWRAKWPDDEPPPPPPPGPIEVDPGGG